MSPSYVESVWWGLKRIWDKGLLGEDHRVAPYCPRCGTTLSDHELAQGYQDDRDPSIYVRFPVTSGPLAGRAKLLVWTTTPWTLVSNTAVAVHPEVRYVVAHQDPVPEGSDAVATASAEDPASQDLIIAEPLFEKVLGEGWSLTGESFLGSQMEFWTYERPYNFLEWPKTERVTVDGRPTPADANFVVLADYVTVEDGTAGASGPSLWRRRSTDLPSLRVAAGQPDSPRRYLRGIRAAGGRAVLQDRRQAVMRRS
ncbi:isoleucyl-tRNA synthetase [Cutibacterium acnes JCM 18920]|nr:isoleucyl-tRNA synthetase [Cutibacterium acnes JCM 18920]